VVGVAALTLLVVSLLSYGFLGRYVIDSQKEQMLDHAEEVARQLENLRGMPMFAANQLRLLLMVDLQVMPDGAAITIFDGERLIWAPAEGLSAADARALYAEGLRVSAAGPGASDLPALGGEQRLIVAAAPFVSSAGDRGVVVVSLPTSEAAAAGRGLYRVLFISAVVGLAVAVVVGLGLGAWLARPLRSLSGAARSMAGGSYAEPVTGKYTGELYDLAAAMESMRREVRRSEQSLRGFVSSAAHELRTPLTSIEGFSQALLDGTASTEAEQKRSAAAIFREAGRLRRLVDALLTLSRFDSREFRPNLVHFEAASLVREEIDRLVGAGLAEPGRVHLSSSSDTSLTTDPDMLRQVLANLLKNAIQYGGEEPVEAAVTADDDRVHIRISNGGPPLPAEERSHLFERFFRGQSHSRTEGFGLGLPLAREILEVLGGRVELEDGGRTTFRVSLPRAAR
jgi:signal transduction histidine kinase